MLIHLKRVNLIEYEPDKLLPGFRLSSKLNAIYHTFLREKLISDRIEIDFTWFKARSVLNRFAFLLKGVFLGKIGNLILLIQESVLLSAVY